MACECPVLSSDVGGVRDLITDGATGWLYPLGDVDAAAVRLSAILDPSEWSTRRRAVRLARRFVRHHHAPAAVAADYRAVLSAVRREQ